jgi:hypothetical protein
MNIALLQALGGLGGGGGIPFKTDLVQHLFKSGATDFITSDGLYARDYSGNNNHALLKNSYMAQSLDGVTVESAILENTISLNPADDIIISLYFKMSAAATNGQNFSMFGDKIGATGGLAAVRFVQGTGIYLRHDDGTPFVLFNAVTDFKTLHHYSIRLNGGFATVSVDGVASAPQAFTFINWTINSLRGTRSLTSVNGGYFDLKLTINSVLTNWWPCQSGHATLFDVVGENHAPIVRSQTTTNNKAFQSVSHYNIKYGCDLIYDHTDFYWFCPRNVNGNRLTNNPPLYPLGGGTVYSLWRWNETFQHKLPFPICETTIQTLEGDISYKNMLANISDKIFTNINYDQTYKDVLVYDTAKTESEITSIKKYLYNDKFDAWVYNRPVMQAIATQIKTGNVKMATVADSMGVVTYRLAEQMMFYAPQKGIGFGILTTGNPIYNNGYADISVLHNSTGFTSVVDGATDELWGVNGVCNVVTGAAEFTIDVINHKYNEFKIFYGRNTGKGTFNITINSVVYPVDTAGTSGLGIFSQAITEGANDIVISGFSGEVVLYGFSLENSTGAINHMLNHGGYQTGNFANTAGAYFQSFFEQVTDLNFGLILLGTNDESVPRTPAQVKANMLTIIGKMRAGQSTLPIMFLTPCSQGDGLGGENLDFWNTVRGYDVVLKEICDEEENVCICNNGLFFPRYVEAAALGFMDGYTHHSVLGQEWEARKMFRTIINS